MAVNEVIVNNPVVDAMGARISLSGPGRSMYLIICHGSLLVSLVKAYYGEIVLALNGSKMLATLPFTGYLGLRNDSRIAHIGPVNIDLQRLTKVARMLVNTEKDVGGSSQ